MNTWYFQLTKLWRCGKKQEKKKNKQVGLTWIIFRDVFSLKWRKTDLFFLCQMQCFWYVRIVYFNASEANCVGICKMCWFPSEKSSSLHRARSRVPLCTRAGLACIWGHCAGILFLVEGLQSSPQGPTTCLPAGTAELDVGLADRFWHKASHMLLWLTLLLIASKTSSCQYVAGGGHVPVLADGNWWL